MQQNGETRAFLLLLVTLFGMSFDCAFSVFFSSHDWMTTLSLATATFIAEFDSKTHAQIMWKTIPAIDSRLFGLNAVPLRAWIWWANKAHFYYIPPGAFHYQFRLSIIVPGKRVRVCVSLQRRSLANKQGEIKVQNQHRGKFQSTTGRAPTLRNLSTVVGVFAYNRFSNIAVWLLRPAVCVFSIYFFVSYSSKLPFPTAIYLTRFSPSCRTPRRATQNGAKSQYICQMTLGAKRAPGW